MKTFFSSAVALALGLSALALSGDARACGGCFNTIQQSESTQVTGHRMILSVSNDTTTLWDQIEYSGAPESFAWVLPIHGQVDIGLSSDALFARLEEISAVQIFSPSINCPPTSCFGTTSTQTATASTGTGGGGVTVIAQETVGPFETVQLASADPQALAAWLDAHGFEIPPDVAPVIDAYVLEGFDFLAMKLVPGKDVSSMQPVRVTSTGAGLGLPLRMVAAGTGAITPITLWIAGEGRHEPANFPWFAIDPEQLVWNWDAQSSNYKQLRQLGFDATNGEGWLVESATALQPVYLVGDPLLSVAANFPEESGYDPDPQVATDLCTQDLDALYGALDLSSFWLTRIHAELPREALATDLQIGAAASQTEVSPYFFVSNSVGTPPSCPPPPDCGDTSSSTGGEGGSGGSGGEGGAGADAGSGCSVGGSQTQLGAALAALALLGVWRRRQRRTNRLRAE